MVVAETTWTPADLSQAVQRCHRLGQTRPVLARVLSLAGSLDERVIDVLVKEANQMRALFVREEAA